MEERIAVGLSSILVAGVTSRLFKALWLHFRLPQGVLSIAAAMVLVVGLSAWAKWLERLRAKQFQKARQIQAEAESFSYSVQEELVERQLDLDPEDRNDMQSRLLRFDQAMPLVLAAVGLLLGLF